MDNGEITDEQLAEIEELANSATPGPWYVRSLDDSAAMNLVAVSTQPEGGAGPRWPEFESGDMIAATLIQSPRYVDIADRRWDENANFIAEAREVIPALVAEIRRLRGITDYL